MILVVEDDPNVARLIALLLQRSGYESEVVADGQTALRKAREMLPEAIFADLTLKGMGGDELCKGIKAEARTRDIPYIIVSGDGDIAEKARRCGADDYMVKPFDPPELIRLVKQYARAQSGKAD